MKNKKPAIINDKKTGKPVSAKNRTFVPYSISDSLFNVTKLTSESLAVLNNFDDVIQGVRPLNSKQLQQLPDNIKNLLDNTLIEIEDTLEVIKEAK